MNGLHVYKFSNSQILQCKNSNFRALLSKLESCQDDENSLPYNFPQICKYEVKTHKWWIC